MTSDPVKMLGSSKSHSLERYLANIEIKWIFNLPGLTMLFSILIPWRSLWFFCPPFTLLWPGKVMPLFTYIRPLLWRVIQPPTDCWICYDAGDAVVLSAHHQLFPDLCFSFSDTRSRDKYIWESGDTVTWHTWTSQPRLNKYFPV